MCMYAVCVYTCMRMCKLKLEKSRKFFSPGGLYIMYTGARTVHENSSLNVVVLNWNTCCYTIL